MNWAQEPGRDGVAIEGKVFNEGTTIPRDAVRDGGKLWVVSQDSTLDVRPVEIQWKERDRVVVGTGLVEGDQVVISAMTAPSDGMAVRVAEDVTAEAKPGGQP